MSGDVTLTGVTADGDLSAGSVSGNVAREGAEGARPGLGSVSGDITSPTSTCDRLGVKSVSGSVEYAGAHRQGRPLRDQLALGNVRLAARQPVGLRAERQQLQRVDPVGAAADHRRRPRAAATATAADAATAIDNHSMRATFGDGSATLIVRTFSGDIVISKR